MKIPVAYGTSWFGVAVGVAPLVAMLAINAWLVPASYPLLAGGIWLMSILVLRRVFTGSHRRAIRLVKAGDFRAAIPAFQTSYDQMCRRLWVDKFRWLLLGSSSRWSYREIALCNAAFCYGQIGDGTKMLELYERALVEFPQSVLATTAIRMMSAASHLQTPNKAPEPTPGLVMPPAEPGVTPSPGVAHLERWAKEEVIPNDLRKEDASGHR